jgi:phage-related protein
MTLFKRLGEGGPAADKLLKTFQEGGPKADKLLKEMGLSLRDIGGQAALSKMTAEQLHEAIAKAMAKKGAGPLADMALTLPAILQKAREGFMSLFGGAGPAVKAFMTAVKSLFGEFSKGSPIINALKPIMTGLLNTLFGWATKAVGAIHALVSSFIAAGKGGGIFGGMVNALKTGWSALVAIFGAVKTALSPVIAALKAIFANALVMDGIRSIFTAIGVAITVVVVIIGGLIAAAAALAGIIAGAFGAIAGVVLGVVGVIGDAIGAAVDVLAGLGSAASDAAGNFIAGLVDGITAGAGAVVAAVTGLAQGAMSAFTGFFGIKSPSRKMREHGQKNIAEEGLGEGINRGAPKVAKAMAKLGGGPLGKGRGRGGEPGEGAGTYIDLRGSTFNGTDEGTIRSVLERVWEELSGEAGASPATT